MRTDPRLEPDKIISSLEADYGLHIVSLEFLPLGFDSASAVYRVTTGDGVPYFLKIWFRPVFESGMLITSALQNSGVPNILAPLLNRSGALWCTLDETIGTSAAVYPFIRGENASLVGLTGEQWCVCGSTLRAVHDSGLHEQFRDSLPVERFAMPSAALVRELQAYVDATDFASPSAKRCAAFWRAQRVTIDNVLTRAETLGSKLQSKSFECVLCHADIHAANILVDEDGRIYLTDWDGPLIAPRERDLLFIIGSKIARTVEPWEEKAFFAGYGSVKVDLDALIYYRYERIIEDLGEFGKDIFLAPDATEDVRSEAADIVINLFAPGGEIECAETVIRFDQESSGKDL